MNLIKDWLERLMICCLVLLTLIWVILRLLAAFVVGATVWLPVFFIEAIIWGITLGIYKIKASTTILEFIEDHIAPQSDDDYDY